MKRKITIKIADKQFELPVSSPYEEEKVRKAAAIVSQEYGKYQREYLGQHREDQMAFIALNICIDNLKMQDAIIRMQNEELQLAKDLDSYLNDIEN